MAFYNHTCSLSMNITKQYLLLYSQTYKKESTKNVMNWSPYIIVIPGACPAAGVPKTIDVQYGFVLTIHPSGSSPSSFLQPSGFLSFLSFPLSTILLFLFPQRISLEKTFLCRLHWLQSPPSQPECNPSLLFSLSFFSLCSTYSLPILADRSGGFGSS